MTPIPALGAEPYAPGYVVASRYQVKEVMALGRLGPVYRAHDRTNGADVALKVLELGLFAETSARSLFVQQMGRLRGLQHRNIVRLFDVIDHGDRCLLVYQLIEGLSLRRVIQIRSRKGQRFRGNEVRPILLQVAAGLGAAHVAGAAHGALRAEDLLLLPDHLKVVGIGVLSALSRRSAMEFMNAQGAEGLAPELRDDRPIDAGTDVYALGALLYELATGRAPSSAEGSPCAVGEPWPAMLDDVLQRALHVDPERRYARTSDFSVDLQAALGSRPTGSLEAVPAPTTKTQTKPLGQRRPPPPPPPRRSGSRTTTPRLPVTPAPQPVETEAVSQHQDQGSADGAENITTEKGAPPFAALATPPPNPMVVATPVVPASVSIASAVIPLEAPRTPRPAKSTVTPPPLRAKTTTPVGVRVTTPPLGRAVSHSMPVQSAVVAPAWRTGLLVAIPILVVGFSLVFLVKKKTDEQRQVAETERHAADDLRKQLKELQSQGRQEVAMAEPVVLGSEPHVEKGLTAVSAQPLLPTETVSNTPTRPAPEVTALEPLEKTAEEKGGARTSQAPHVRNAQPSLPSSSSSPEARTSVVAPTVPPPVPKVDESPKPAAASCPAAFAMRLIATRKTADVVAEGYCIDPYEFPGAGAMPRTSVSWEAARQLCGSRGARLCTTVEWERACYGKGGSAYPYGKEWDAAKCNTQSEDGAERPVVPTGSLKTCKSAYGVYDMSGNVAEWVQDKVVQGGSASKPDYATQCSSQGAGSASPMVGFRCCADLIR